MNLLVNHYQTISVHLTTSASIWSVASEMDTENEGDGEKARYFVAVHVGAGFHAPSNEKSFRRVMKRACLAAASILRKVVLANPLTGYPLLCSQKLTKEEKKFSIDFECLIVYLFHCALFWWCHLLIKPQIWCIFRMKGVALTLFLQPFKS